MKRREFLKKAGAAAVGAGLSPLMFARAQSSQTYRWGMPTSWPVGLDTLHGGAQNFAAYVNDISQGQMQVEVHPAGSQIGALEVYDAVASGAFELGHTASYYYLGKTPAHAFFTCVPFGMTVDQINAWVYTGGGQGLWDELNAPDGLVGFLAGNTGAQMGAWFNKEIDSPDDLRGVSFRTAGLGAQVLAAAGVNVQTLPGGEIFLALERGAIDAAEWVGPHDDEILGLHRAARYYYGPGWAEPGAALCVYANLDAFNALPAHLQQTIRIAAKAANVQMASDYAAKDPAAYQRILAAGAQPRVFPDSVLAVLHDNWVSINDNLRNTNAGYRRISDSATAFLDALRPFDRGNRHAFLEFVYGR